MRLLDRYLLRELLVPLAYCIVFFLVAFIAFDVFDQVDSFQKNQLTAADIAEYYVNKAPEFLVTSFILPMALLLASLYALTTHARHHELTAMRAAGIPLWRIAMPYFAVGFLFSLIALYVNEKLVPEGAENAEAILVRHSTDQPKARMKIWRPNVFFVNQVENRTWRIGAYHMRRDVMLQPQFDWRRVDGSRMQVLAEGARWVEGQWVFTNAEQLVYGPEVGALPTVLNTNQLVVPELTETPRIIRSEIKVSFLSDSYRSIKRVHLSSAEISEYLELHPRLERRTSNLLRTLLHSRLAAPWICIVVVLIAVPFGSLPGRRNVYVGVASSVFICFAFLITRDLSVALGGGGYLPAPLAAWLPNAVFGLGGAALMWRVR
jgi:lipopolysaccharide export system permease protein